MNLRAVDIQSKKKVGDLDGRPVIEVVTTGGLNMLLAAKGEGMETLATGPHRCVSRHIALSRYPKLRLTELKKSESVPLETYQHLLPRWEAFTDTCNRLLKK